MPFLPSTDPQSGQCGGHLICDTVYRVTGNAEVSKWSTFIIGKPLAIIGLIALGLVIRAVLHRLVGRIAQRAERGVLPDRAAAQVAARRKQRAATMAGVLNSFITIVVIAVVGTMALSELGVNIAPIIASAGILGLALGFGAQSLVKDFLAGIFIFIEDQYGVGDVVNVSAEASGTVEAVTLRMTRLRDVQGTVWYVPNGEILRVGNMSQNWSRAVVDVQVGPDEDLNHVQDVLRDIGHGMWDDEDYNGILIEEPVVTGVEDITLDAITVRIMVKTAPLQQWAVARTLRQRVKSRFDHEGIEIPFSQRMVWHREDKAEVSAHEGHGGHEDDGAPAPASGE